MRSTTVWYAGKLRTGGVLVFSTNAKYTKEEVTQLRQRFIWLSRPLTSRAQASTWLMAQLRSNPPSKVMVVHSGKIVVQHLQDPTRKSSRQRKTSPS